MSSRYRDRDWMVRHYINKGLDQYEIASLCDVDQSTISRWLEKHGIKSRPRGTGYSPRVPLKTHRKGYERWEHEIQDLKLAVRVHRLLAVAEHGFDEVADKHVHHKNQIPWDNRPDNIEIMEPSEHIRLHNQDGGVA